MGAAYREGFDRGLETGAARIYQMDADFSHDPTALPPMGDRMLDGADLVLGSRYVDGGAVEGWPPWRMFLSRGGSLYAGAILGREHRDMTGGYKAWQSDTLDALRVGSTASNGHAFQVETTDRAQLAGAHVEEVPIVFRDRQAGASKMGLSIVLEAARIVPALRLFRPKSAPCPPVWPDAGADVRSSFDITSTRSTTCLAHDRPPDAQVHRWPH